MKLKFMNIGCILRLSERWRLILYLLQYTLKSSLFCDVTRCSSVIGYRLLAKTYVPYLHRSSKPFLDCMTLEYGTETSVTNYQPTSRNIPEERRAQLNSGGSLKSRVIHTFTRQIRKFNFYFLLRTRTSAGLFWTRQWMPNKRRVVFDQSSSCLFFKKGSPTCSKFISLD